MCEIDDGQTIYIGFNPCDVSVDKSKLRIIKYFIVNNESKNQDSYKDKKCNSKIRRLIKRK